MKINFAVLRSAEAEADGLADDEDDAGGAEPDLR